MNNTSQIIQEAKRLLKEDRNLKHYEAMRQAKKMHKKDPQDGNPKGAKKNNI